MNHAIKEQISDNTLYVEVEPQPVSGSMGGRKNWTLHQGVINFIAWSERNLIQYLVANGSPISIGDTVCQGEEWQRHVTGDYLLRVKQNPGKAVRPPQTMPIELADKTFKVVGIEVELMPRHVATPSKPLADCDYRDLDEAWFWKYSLEEI